MTSGTPTRLPGPLRSTASFPFVGRAREVATLRALIPGEVDEPRRIALVGGEAGSGKSRLVRELAHTAAEDGALVLYGACDSVVGAPYGPVVEALEYLVRTADPAALREDLGGLAGELRRLLPDLPSRVGPLPEPSVADPDTERHRLHTAVTDLLAAVGRRRPVVLVLEDGHWADGPTLMLLRHLARTTTVARLLVVATFRDTEADVPAELASALADLRRSEGVVRIRLEPFTSDEIAAFVGAAAGLEAGSAPVEVALAIEELTRGNAFLVTELWRMLLETGALELTPDGVRLVHPLAELGSPEGVREVVSQRLRRLAPATIELLELAAAIGPLFQSRLLERASTLDRPDLVRALEEAERSGMIEEVSAPGLVWSFTHELVRRALYDRLATGRRAELHRRIGEALEEIHAGDPDRVLPDLAYHFAAAAPLVDETRAVDYSLRAARAARAALAFGDAVRLLRQALRLGVPEPSERAAVYLEIGAASHLAGRSDDALEAFSAAARIAREHGDAATLARAAVGYEDACWRPAIVDREAVDLLVEADAALGETESELRVAVLSGLARGLANRGEHRRAAVVRASAREIAERLGDSRGLATILTRAYWAQGTSSLDEILVELGEAVALAEELGDAELQAEAMEWRLAARMALGELETARREVEEVLELAGGMRQPFILHVAEHYAAAIALCQGRLAEADEAAVRSYEWTRLMTGTDASGPYGLQMFSIRREQGRLGEVAPVLELLARTERSGGLWRPGFAAALAELGLHDRLRRELRLIADEGLQPLRETIWLGSLTYLADACAAVSDGRVAALVYPELADRAGTNVTIGHGVVCYGAADRYLGMLATVLGEWERADAHFEAALALNRRMGADTWLARSAYEHARMLRARGRPADRARAELLLGDAAALADRIGMASLRVRIREAGLSVAPPRTLPDDLSAREVQILRLLARGLTNREIGRELSISEHTAANHVRSILRKTGSANRTEAASYAHRRGLVES